MLPYVFTQNAQGDIVSIVRFYEEKQDGLGLRFLTEIEQAAEVISILPTGYASYYKNTRERKTKNFPYKLIYTIDKEVVYIHAVYPSKSDPERKYKAVKRKMR